jgi:hypothetical protein
MKKRLLFFVFATSLMFFSIDGHSQCAMCRRVAETGHENENSAARGLNSGILYLLAIPYVIGGIGIFAWYKNRKKE